MDFLFSYVLLVNTNNKKIRLNMNYLVSKKDQQGQFCIIDCWHGIATKLHCSIESTSEVVLKATDICGNEILRKGV